MSKEVKSPQNNTEEIDLGELFKLIGKAFDRFFGFIGSIFNKLFLIFVWFVFFTKKHIIKFAIVSVLGIALGFVKNLIDNDPAVTPEYKAQMHKELVQLYELEVADRDSARKREVEKAKTGQFDLMFNLTGIIGLSAFAFIIYAIVYLQIPESNKEVWIHLIGICEGIVLSIFGYFYGSAVRKNKE